MRGSECGLCAQPHAAGSHSTKPPLVPGRVGEGGLKGPTLLQGGEQASTADGEQCRHPSHREEGWCVCVCVHVCALVYMCVQVHSHAQSRSFGVTKLERDPPHPSQLPSPEASERPAAPAVGASHGQEGAAPTTGGAACGRRTLFSCVFLH